MNDEILKLIPKNIPNNSLYKYIWLVERGYKKYIELVYYFGGYVTKKQFIEIIKKDFSIKTNDSARKRTERIIKELLEYDFIKTDSFNRHKYIILRTSALAVGTKDYINVNRLSNIKNYTNNKFLISMMKAENYIINNYIIDNSTLVKHLKGITARILKLRMENPNLIYDIEIMKVILKENNIDNIRKYLINFDDKNILKILWINIYDIYYSLKLHNHTVAMNALYFKLHIHMNEVKLHYVPVILIFDIHNNKYYKQKIAKLFDKFNNIPTNVTMNMQYTYESNRCLGFEGYNHIGYAFKLIGYRKESLIKKQNYINSFLGNKYGAMVGPCEIEFLDIEKHIGHQSVTKNNFLAVDTYVKSILSV